MVILLFQHQNLHTTSLFSSPYHISAMHYRCVLHQDGYRYELCELSEKLSNGMCNELDDRVEELYYSQIISYCCSVVKD